MSEEQFYPSSIQEAVQHLLANTKNLEELKAMEEKDLISLHHGFGMGLRNGFDLWGAQRGIPCSDLPISQDYWLNYGGREKTEAYAAKWPDRTIPVEPEADGVSMTIIRELWKALQEQV